jgi:CubicO group peptidase (beta-lactamase class C family)
MRIALLLAALLCLPTPVLALDWPALERELGLSAAEMVKGRKAGGVGVAVIADGEIRLLQAHGLADRATKTRFSIDTPVPAGDLSRLATALITMRLVESGRLDLDAAVTALAPELRFTGATTAPDRLRVRDLMSGHSGLTANRLYGMYRKPGDSIPPDPLAAPLWLVHEPRMLGLDSNLAWAVLGRVLEQVSGQDLDALVAAELSAPLALATASFQRPSNLSSAHRNGKAEPALIARDRAALGFVASTADLARLLQALIPTAGGAGWDYLRDSSREELWRPQNSEVALDVGNEAGLAFELATSVRPGVGRVAILSSTYPSFRAEIRLLPEHRLAILAVSNWRESGEVLYDWIAESTDRILEAKAGIPPREKERPLPEVVPMPAGADTDSLAARYVTPIGLMAFTEEDTGRYNLGLMGLDFRADLRDDGWYGLRFRLFGLLPLKLDFVSRVALRPVRIEGRRVLIAWAQDRHFLLGSPLPERPAAAWPADLVGRYRLVNGDALADQLEVKDVKVLVEDGWGWIEYELPFVLTLAPRIALEPLGNDRLRIAGFGPNLGEELRVIREDGKVQLEFSGYLLEKR